MESEQIGQVEPLIGDEHSLALIFQVGILYVEVRLWDYKGQG